MTDNITFESILSLMKEKYREYSGAEAEDSGDIEIRMKILAGELFSLMCRINSLEKRIFPDTATGEDLDNHALQRGIKRKTASTAEGELTFRVAVPSEFDILIPAETVCAAGSESDCRYITAEEATIPAGETETTVAAKAADKGRNGNCAAGKVTAMITPPAGVDSVTNKKPFTGGGNDETDESLRKRVLKSWSTIANGGNLESFEEVALSFEDVLKARTIPIRDGAGTIRLMIVTKEGAYTTELRNAIKNACKELLTIGSILWVGSADENKVNVELLVKIKEGFSEYEVLPACKNALLDYFSSLLIGEEIRICDMGKLIMEIPGTENYRFVTPAKDIVPAADSVAVPAITVSGRFQ